MPHRVQTTGAGRLGTVAEELSLRVGFLLAQEKSENAL
jgi:hypothetical protein